MAPSMGMYILGTAFDDESADASVGTSRGGITNVSLTITQRFEPSPSLEAGWENGPKHALKWISLKLCTAVGVAVVSADIGLIDVGNAAESAKTKPGTCAMSESTMPLAE